MGHNYPNHPILGNIMMILMCIPFGIILFYSYIKSGNIFVPIMHGILNQFSSTVTTFYKRITIQSITLWFNWTCWNSDFSLVALFLIKTIKKSNHIYNF